jgi:hypothetical protein
LAPRQALLPVFPSPRPPERRQHCDTARRTLGVGSHSRRAALPMAAAPSRPLYARGVCSPSQINRLPPLILRITGTENGHAAPSLPILAQPLLPVCAVNVLARPSLHLSFSLTNHLSVEAEAMAMMNWKDLLCTSRSPEASRKPGDGRSDFERDFDRILFSTPARRLSAKTQVFPMDPMDSTRTRLTHSHEAATLARALGLSLEGEPLPGLDENLIPPMSQHAWLRSLWGPI